MKPIDWLENMGNNPIVEDTTSQINNRIDNIASLIESNAKSLHKDNDFINIRLHDIESDNTETKAYIGTLRARFQEIVDNIDIVEKTLFATILVVAVMCIIVNVYCFGYLANNNKDYISLAEIQSYDHSQLAMTDTDYYSWYDYDRATGKVYIVMRRDGDIIGVVDAYGKDGKPLYIEEEDE